MKSLNTLSLSLLSTAAVGLSACAPAEADGVARVRWFDERANTSPDGTEFLDASTAQDLTVSGDFPSAYTVEFPATPPETALKLNVADAVVSQGAIGRLTIERDGPGGTEILEQNLDILVVYLPDVDALAAAADRISGDLAVGFNFVGAAPGYDDCAAAAAAAAEPCFADCNADEEACDVCNDLVDEGEAGCGTANVTLPLSTTIQMGGDDDE